MRAIHLEQHVIADAVHERAEAARGLDAPWLPKRLQYTEECLLSGIVDLSGRSQSRSKLDRQQIAEIPREVALGVGVSRRQSIEVSPVKLESPVA
jgi:hypothetical protein